MNKYGIKSNNRGLSLVELIIAISIGAIVSASIAALITFSIRTYHNESVNTAMQYEIQTNVNQMMDAIMGASGVVINNNADKTDYAGFGHFDVTRDDTGKITSVSFYGVVLVSGEKDSNNVFEIYMRNIDKAHAVTFTTTAETQASADKAVSKAAKVIKDATDKKPYLLGQYAKAFKLSINTDTDKSSCIVTGNKYINPLVVDVELEFEKDGSGKKINKRVKDNAVIRNKVTTDIYLNGTKYELK